MAQQIVNLGSGPDTPGADSHFTAHTKHNANATELYGSVAALQSATISVSATAQTASYTLALADAGTIVEMNVATANTVTVPPNASVAVPVGAVVEVCQVGAGQTTIAAGAGVTIRTAGTLAIRAQWSSVSLRKRAVDEWVLAGDTA